MSKIAKVVQALALALALGAIAKIRPDKKVWMALSQNDCCNVYDYTKDTGKKQKKQMSTFKNKKKL